MRYHEGVLRGEGASLSWDPGTRQFTQELNGEWTDLPVASPLDLQTIGDQGFFRVKVGTSSQ